MKRLFLVMVAFAALLTSCSKETVTPDADQVEVTFNVTPDLYQTRADDYVYGDGYYAYDLEWAIFLSGSYSAPLFSGEIKGAFAGTNKTTQFSQSLAVGREYQIVFWADADLDPYTIDWSKQLVTLETEGLQAQRESLDAFYRCETFTVMQDTRSKTFSLKRPLAQLNIATADFGYASSVGLNITHTAVEVSDVYTQMNLLTGEVIEETKGKVSFSAAPIPTGKNTTVTINNVTYNLLSMNYLLVNAEQLSQVKFKKYEKNVNVPISTSIFNNIHLQRNHRTYIIGQSLLTNDVNFTVTIVEGFDNEDKPYVEYRPSL